MMTATCVPVSGTDGLLDDGLTESKLPGRGRPSAASLAQRGGSYGLVVLIGHEGGRWTKEVRTNTGLRRKLVCSTASDGFLRKPDGLDIIRGLAVIRTWSAVGERASHSDTHNLMQAAQKA